MSSAITPAVTLDSTASMNARRVSSWVLAAAKRAGLLLEPPGHPVEGGRQRLDLVLGVGDRHSRREVALLDPPCGVDQLADRTHQPVGDLQRGQDREPDDDQRAEQQRGIEAQLVDARAFAAAT